MKLTTIAGLFVAQTASRDEGAAPKAAGFRWHGRECYARCPACAAGVQRWVWYTTEPALAARLIAYADDATAAVLAPKAEAQAASRTVAGDAAALPEGIVPAGRQLLPFQIAGVLAILARFAQHAKGVLLGDEMGLGKTVQSIIVANTLPASARILVLCPASLRGNWLREIKRWDTAARDVRCTWDRTPMADRPGIVVAHYDALVGATAAALRESLTHSWDLIVADEAHYLKNEKAQRTRAILGTYVRGVCNAQGIVAGAQRVILATGTPVPNAVREALPLLRAIDAEVARDEKRFLFRFCGATNNGHGWSFTGGTRLPELQDRLRADGMVRRLKADVLRELPAKRRALVPLCDDAARRYAATEADRDGFEALAEAVRRAGLTFEEQVGEAGGHTAAFEALARMRADLAEAKVGGVIEHLDGVLEEQAKVVVFAHHQSMIRALAAHFGDACVVLDGNTPMTERDALVQRFQTDASVRVFVGSTRAAGVGLTLTAASHVVVAEADWNPSWLVQAEDRCHRIGQLESVLVQYLIIEGTLDAHVLATAVEKLDVADRALDRDRVVPEVAVGLPAPTPAPASAHAQVTIEPKGERPITYTITADVRDAALAAMRTLAGMCDGAYRLDGAGFSKLDASFGHKLAACASLSDKQAAWALYLARKYQRQLDTALLARCGVVR